MAKSNRDSSSNSSRHSNREARVNIMASCYAVDAASYALTGFHYSATGAGVTENEARSQQQQHQQQHRQDYEPARNQASFVGGGVAHHITEECERFFCERLRSTFLGERKAAHTQDSLVMGVQSQSQQKTEMLRDGGSVAAGPARRGRALNDVTQFLEMFDYRGDMRFRGFVSSSAKGESTMFVFFEPDVAGKDLKSGLVALLELASEDAFSCSEMVVCLDRSMSEQDMTSTTRDLGWVGFEVTTLEPWSCEIDDVSEDWLFLAMET